MPPKLPPPLQFDKSDRHRSGNGTDSGSGNRQPKPTAAVARKPPAETTFYFVLKKNCDFEKFEKFVKDFDHHFVGCERYKVGVIDGKPLFTCYEPGDGEGIEGFIWCDGRVKDMKEFEKDFAEDIREHFAVFLDVYSGENRCSFAEDHPDIAADRELFRGKGSI